MDALYRLFFPLFIALAPTPMWAQTRPLEECASMYENVGLPQYQGIEAQSQDQFTLLCRQGYVLAHNNARKVPDWVMERLTPERFLGRANRSRSTFAADNDLPPDHRSELNDYRASSFDRGHMAPAADMKFDQGAMNESFLLSNMAPQVGIGFNRHIWAHLEDQVRGWTQRRQDLMVITGPVYGTKTIGGGEGRCSEKVLQDCL